MEYLVDIPMCAYNHEAYIADALEGIVNQQTSFNYRLIIGEDCSTDNTRAIIKSYQERFPDKIKPMYHDRNLGAHENSRLLFKACTSKYVALCDGDDYWTDPLKLQTLVGFLEEHPDFAIAFHKISINKDGEFMDDYITDVPGEVSTQADLLELNNYIHTPSVVFRNCVQNLPEWFRRAMPGDFPLYLIATNNGGKIRYFDTVMAVYRIHAQGMWSMQNKQKYNQQICFSMLICARHIGCRNLDFIRKYVLALADTVFRFGYTHLSRREYLSLITWAMKIVRFTPKQIAYFLSPSLRRLVKK